MSDYTNWTRDANGRMVAKEIDAKYIDPSTGRIIPLAERTAAGERAKTAASIAASIARREADSRLTDLQKRIRLFEQQEQAAVRSGDTAAIKQYGDALIDLRLQQQQSDRREAFDSDELVRNYVQQSEQLAKSGRALYPGADPSDIENAIAVIQGRHDWPDAQSFKAAASAALDKISSDNLAHHRRKESAAAVAAAKAELDLANSKVARSDAELRGVQIQGDGTNGG